MKHKVLIDHSRRRTIPSHFTWVDHRIVRDGYVRKCSVEALGFYLFLLGVSDSEGLSYYGDKRIAEELNSRATVSSLRNELISAGLIAYRDGIYQVLGLQHEIKEEHKGSFTSVCKVSDVLSSILGGMKNG